MPEASRFDNLEDMEWAFGSMGIQDKARHLATLYLEDIGDLITEAGQEKVTSVKELEARVDEAREAGRKSLLLLVRRDGDPRFVALSLDAS